MVKVGDKVTIRSWDDMLDEFGYDDGAFDDSINISEDIIFATGMRAFCDTEVIVASIEDYEFFTIEGEIICWTFSMEMVVND